jgi:hypothetical protein
MLVEVVLEPYPGCRGRAVLRRPASCNSHSRAACARNGECCRAKVRLPQWVGGGGSGTVSWVQGAVGTVTPRLLQQLLAVGYRAPAQGVY